MVTGAGRDARQRSQRLVHQRVLASDLEPAHLTQDRRGMQPLTPGDGPKRGPLFDMIQVKAHRRWKPGRQAGGSQFWQFNRPVLVHAKGVPGPALDLCNLGWNWLPVR